jgi:hypothetical protein
MSRRIHAAASAALLATLLSGSVLFAPAAMAGDVSVQACLKATNKLDDTKTRLDKAEKDAVGLDASVSRLNYLLKIDNRNAVEQAELDKIQAVLSLRALKVVDLNAKNTACKTQTTTPTSTVTATPSAPPTTTVTSTEHITQYDGGSVARIPSRAPETGGGPVDGASWAELLAVVASTVVAVGAYGAARVRRVR